MAAIERRERRLAALQALQYEVEVVKRIAANGSVVVLPTSMLTVVASDLLDVPDPVRGVLEVYSEAVYRYSGRVHRLVEYGAAKRAAGMRPGPEKVDDEQVQRVLSAADTAVVAVSDYVASEAQSPRTPVSRFARLRAGAHRRQGSEAAT